MTKEELLSRLQLCINTEESAVPVYTKHISNTFFLSEFSAAEKHTVVDILKMLSRDSEGHAAIYRSLVKEVEGSNKDVY